MRKADKVVYATLKQLSADLSALQAMLRGSLITMHYANQEYHPTYRSNIHK